MKSNYSTIKPQVGSYVDWSNPISNGMWCCYNFNEKGGTNAYDACRKAGTLTFSGTPPLWTELGLQVGNGKGFIENNKTVKSLYNPIADDITVRILHMPRNWPGSFTCMLDVVDNSNTRFISIFANASAISYRAIGHSPAGAASNTLTQPVNAVSDLVASFRHTGSNAGVITWYLNGRAIFTDTTGHDGTAWDANGYRFSVGGNPSGGGNLYDGQYQKIQIWNRALRSDEVSWLYSNPYGDIRVTPVANVYAIGGFVVADTYTADGTGSLSIFGLSSESSTVITYATGKLLLSGVATEAVSVIAASGGNLFLSGVATTTISSFSVEPLGLIALSGTADAVSGFYVNMVGSLRFDGIVTSGAVDGTGQLTISTSADVVIGFIYNPVGGLTWTGLASGSSAYEVHGLKVTQFALELLYIGNATDEYDAVGSLSFGGQAPHFMFLQPDLTFSGLSDYVVSYGVIDNTGGLALSGSAKLQLNYSHVGSGGLIISSNDIVMSMPDLRFDGMAEIQVDYSYVVNGVLRFSGIDQLEADYAMEPTGSLTLSGLAVLSAQATLAQEFTWKVLQTQSLTKEFTWSVGSRPVSFYRVTGKCRPALCPPLKPSDCNSNITFVVNILARSVSEVCLKLKQRNFKFPIATIEQFSNPASILTPADTSCNQLIDVTPTFSNLVCVDLLVDIDVTESMVMGAVFIKAFAQEGRGGFFVKGFMPFTAFRVIEPEGGFTFNGVADVVMNNYIWNASGSFGLSDLIELALTAWAYTGSGVIQFNGLAVARLILADWTGEPVGSLSLSGINPITTGHVNYLTTGAITTGLSTGLDFSLEFAQNGTGKKTLRGTADVYLQHYQHEPLGAIGLRGLTRFVSSSYTITPTGGFFLKGSVPYIGSGKLTFSGVATVVYGQQSPNGGRVRFTGAALVEIPVAEGTGSLTFGGAADVLCSDLGIVNLGVVGMTDLVASQNVVFAFVPAPFAQPVTTRVITPCCSETQPISFVLEQNLSSLNYFSKFLQRNALSWPKILVLSYNSRSKIWAETITLNGFAPEYPGTERWNITCIWDCVTDGTPAWRLNITFNQKSSANKHRVSKMVFYFDNTQVCKKSKTVNFPFTFNSRIITSTPSSIRPIVFEDEIGLFKNSTFIASPTISLKISETHTDTNSSAVNVAPQIRVSSDRGINLVEAIAGKDSGSAISVLVNPDGSFVTTVTPPALPPSS